MRNVLPNWNTLHIYYLNKCYTIVYSLVAVFHTLHCWIHWWVIQQGLYSAWMVNFIKMGEPHGWSTESEVTLKCTLLMSYIGSSHKADLCDAAPLHHSTWHNVIMQIMYKILIQWYIRGITAAALSVLLWKCHVRNKTVFVYYLKCYTIHSCTWGLKNTEWILVHLPPPRPFW